MVGRLLVRRLATTQLFLSNPRDTRSRGRLGNKDSLVYHLNGLESEQVLVVFWTDSKVAWCNVFERHDCCTSRTNDYGTHTHLLSRFHPIKAMTQAAVIPINGIKNGSMLSPLNGLRDQPCMTGPAFGYKKCRHGYRLIGKIV